MIYEFTLAPIESVLETIFVILVGISNSYFLSLVLLAILVRLATKPLEKYANRAVSSQAEIELVLVPQVEAIERELTAAPRHEAIKRLYGRYAYHPFYAIRSLAGLGVQLPFFIAAYFMLTGFEPLVGVIVPVLGDLGKPDSLLFGSVHLMPFVMTLVNVAALLTAPGFSRKNLMQGLFVSLMFLVLLYTSPLALLIYWTTSNLFSLVSNFTPFIREKLGLKQATRPFKDTLPGRSFEEYAYIFFICNLAVLVPLLGVLGNQFTFFTAHSLPGSSILAMLLVIGLAPALVLSVLRWLSKRIGFEKLFDGVVLLVFLGLFLFYTANKVGYGVFPSKYEPYILFCLALLLTAAAVTFVLKAQLLKFLSYLSLIIPLVLLNFVYVSPASTLFRHSAAASSPEVAGMKNTPVFLLVFDEFSGLTLQNLKGELDGSRYPGFAELAAQADYFPNALTTDEHTSVAVPSIVSGNLRIGKNGGLAPGENLIETFQAQGLVHAWSTVLPADLLYKRDTSQHSLVSDFITLYVHILCHQDWIKEKIGVIPQTWKGFGVFFKKERNRQNGKGVNPYVSRFFDWVDHVEDSGLNSKLNFLHIQFPHVPHNTTSLGRLHENGTLMLPKLQKTGPSEHFDADQALLNVAYHNYMRQSSYADHMVVKFIQALRDKLLFDKSLIIVTSDHGVSYNKKGSSRRDPFNKDSWKNVVSVPLFVKYPFQKDGKIVPSFVTTLDISTTIMNVVGRGSPWESVGQDLSVVQSNSQTRSVKLVPGYEKYFKNINSLFQEVRVRKEGLFGEGSPVHSRAVNYSENPIYAALPGTKVTALTTGTPSNLHAFWEGSLEPEEVSYFGTLRHGNRPVNHKVIAAVVDNEIQAVLASGKALDQDGFFALSLPRKGTTPGEFNVSLYEIEGETQFRFKKIETVTTMELQKYAFSQSKQRYPYDWKNSVRGSHGLDDLRVGKSEIKVLSTENNDPYVVFESISENAISEPIFYIKLGSDRDLSIDLYYQTLHMPMFDESQRLRHKVKKGINTIYIKIPEKDFIGPFRIDIGSGGATEVTIQEIELRQ